MRGQASVLDLEEWERATETFQRIFLPSYAADQSYSTQSRELR